MRSIALLVIVFLGCVSVAHAKLGADDDLEFIHMWYLSSGSDWYGFTAVRHAVASPETTTVGVHFGPLGRVHFDHPSHFPVLPFGAALFAAFVLGSLAFFFRARIAILYAGESTKPVEPTGTSSSPSDLITSHTSGDSPGGSLRR